jgi:hypothetical protein
MLEEFIEQTEEPYPDPTHGAGYRCSGELKDGTMLPCIMIRRRQPMTDLALRRFAEEQAGSGIFRSYADPYRQIVSHFVTSSNRVDAIDMARVTRSRFAIPPALLRRIESETLMSWTGFVLEMIDGERFAFGTTYLNAFFDLPEGYDFGDVKDVLNHSYLDAAGEVRSIRENVEAWRQSFQARRVFQARPYFT